MSFNTYGLGNSAFTTGGFPAQYPTGTLLASEDGTAYRARQVQTNMSGDTVQFFSVLDLEGSIGLTTELPEDVRVVWFPNEEG